MAVLTTVAGLKVEVIVNAVPLEEYEWDEGEVSASSTVNKYIESTSGAEFEIHYSCPFDLKHDFEVLVYIDREYMDGDVHSRSINKSQTYIIDGAKSTSGTQWFNRRFSFAQLKTDDSDIRNAADHLKEILDKVGVISVEFHWIIEGPRITNFAGFKDKCSAPLGTIPEKALKGKALSHQASLRARQSIRSETVVSTTRIDKNGIPFARFDFHYRSRDALKALCVIARSPSPVPLEDRPLEELSPEEMRELLQRQREREVMARKVKRERIDEGRSKHEDDEELSLTNERPSKRIRNVSAEDIEVIDLT